MNILKKIKTGNDGEENADEFLFGLVRVLLKQEINLGFSLHRYSLWCMSFC